MYHIVIKSKARKQLKKIEKKYRERIALAVDHLAINPFLGKKLEGEYEGGYAIRVWPYRIIYTIEKSIITITIVAIGHRKDVYRML